MKILRQNDTKMHLGVTNATDITQLVDMGLGRAFKVRIGDLQDEWMAQDNTDEKWAGDFPMWKKRVLLTQWAVQAWDALLLILQQMPARLAYRQSTELMTISSVLVVSKSTRSPMQMLATSPRMRGATMTTTTTTSSSSRRQRRRRSSRSSSSSSGGGGGGGGGGGAQGGRVPETTATMTIKRVRRTRPTLLMTTRRMNQLIPSTYYHLLVQRRLHQDIRFSNHARVLR